MKTYEQFNESKGPLVKEYFYDNGQKKSERWFLMNNHHREDGPAIQKWYENGQKESEIWILNDKLHRENGPAFQSWYENGQKEIEEWRLNNIEYSREDWIKKLKEIDSPHYEEQKMLYDMEKYNL